MAKKATQKTDAVKAERKKRELGPKGAAAKLIASSEGEGLKLDERIKRHTEAAALLQKTKDALEASIVDAKKLLSE